MLPVADACEECVPTYLRRGLPQFVPATAFSAFPFILTFIVVATLAWHKLFPILTTSAIERYAEGHNGKAAPYNGASRGASPKPETIARALLKHAPAVTFSTTIALSTVLAELIFCEISNTLNPAARQLALQITISILLVSLIIVTPALEIHSITSAWSIGQSRGRARFLAWSCDILGLASWLGTFWYVGKLALNSHPRDEQHGAGNTFSEGSLERIGIVGILLMASLAGFAAVSSLWQSFGARDRKVSETDIARKQAGLEATTDLLAAKRSRYRALQQKTSLAPSKSFMGRMANTFRPNTDSQELAVLQMEISGLETMQLQLSSSAHLLRTRRDAQQYATTTVGRACTATSYIFSIYCLYRIAATSTAFCRRWWRPSTTFANSDPINNALALVAAAFDPTLDRAAWSRQISFLISGLMLLASFNAVLQTVLLFSRFTPPRLLASAQQNLALLVSQISATYVVSSALLLRSNLPKEMGSVIEIALKAPLDTAFVERWFEGWFLGSCVVTAAGIFVGRSIRSGMEWDDGEDMDLESGKRS